MYLEAWQPVLFTQSSLATEIGRKLDNTDLKITNWCPDERLHPYTQFYSTNIKMNMRNDTMWKKN